MLNFLKITGAIAVLSAISAFAAPKEPLDTVNRQPVPKWSWNVKNNGELTITLPGNSYALRTRISYPHMPKEGWYLIPGNAVKVTKDGAKTVVDFKCKYYTLHRTIHAAGHKLVVRDTYKNITSGDLAIAFDNILTPARIPKKDNVRIAGCYRPGSAPVPDSPAQNSSILFENPNGTLAMVLEDDFYRLQAALKKSTGRGAVQNRSFALPPNDSYTFEFSFYPIGNGDYWDFINQLRRDWKLNTKIDGNLIFCTCPHPQVASYTPEILQNAVVKYLGGKYIGGTNNTWYGQPSFWITPGSRNFMKDYVSRDHQLKKLLNASKKVRKWSPDLSVVARIQTVFGAPPQGLKDPVPYADSVIIEANGKPKQRISRSRDKKPVGFINLHYPMVGNSYYKLLVDLVNKAMDSGIKTIYFDTFCYSFWSLYGRWTYDRWDNRTVDIDQKTWTIAKKKADLAVLSSDAAVELNKLITKRGGKMFFNGTPTTRKQMSILPTSYSFAESSYNQLPITQHASHPVNLGYYPGYQTRKNAWKTPKDMYENAMDNLEYGCLTYVYWLTSKLPTAPTIYARMFPITIKNIYAGCVEGEERIVTKRSGKYSFGTNTEPEIYIYNKEGVESSPTADQVKFETVDGKVIVHLTLPEGFAAVLEKQTENVRDALANELNF